MPTPLGGADKRRDSRCIAGHTAWHSVSTRRCQCCHQLLALSPPPPESLPLICVSSHPKDYSVGSGFYFFSIHPVILREQGHVLILPLFSEWVLYVATNTSWFAFQIMVGLPF